MFSARQSTLWTITKSDTDFEDLPSVNYSESDVSPNAPRLSLEMQLYHPEPQVSINSPIRIHLVIRRRADGLDKPCTLVWHNQQKFARAQFVLLLRTGKTFKRVDVAADTFARPEEDVIEIQGYNDGLYQLSPNSTTRPAALTLTENYHRMLKVGESYRLLWPGEVVRMWDWGSIHDHIGKDLKSSPPGEDALPQLILPACAGVDFTVVEKSGPWRPSRSFPPPLPPSLGVPGAPALKMVLECNASHIQRKGDLSVTSHVIYDRTVTSDEEARPVTFHIWSFESAFRLYRLRNG